MNCKSPVSEATTAQAFTYHFFLQDRYLPVLFVSFLAYTQVATLSVYSYLFMSMFTHQYLLPDGENLDRDTFPSLNITFSTSETYLKHTPDIYIPIFGILEFIGYMGWIKVAETLLNPWGDDDEDFQINYLIDRNFQVNNFELKAIWSSK